MDKKIQVAKFYYNVIQDPGGGRAIHLDNKDNFLKNSSNEYILPARLFGLSYIDYLRLCRDRLYADIRLNENQFPIPYFNQPEVLREFVKTLNLILEVITSKGS